MKDKAIAPSLHANYFDCPLCRVRATQAWAKATTSAVWISDDRYFLPSFSDNGFDKYDRLKMSRCFNCEESLIWLDDKVIYPDVSLVAPPHEDMPESAKDLYMEAASIVGKSPRASMAILRLAVEDLVNNNFGGQPNKSLYSNIQTIISSGKYPSQINKSLEAIRLYGNIAAHNAEFLFDKPKDHYEVIFELLNVMIDSTITQDKKLNSIIGTLPESDQNKINQSNVKKVDQIEK